MNLYIMRHGIAEDREAWGDRPDRDRPLTRKGAKRVRGIARALSELGISLDAVVTSGFVRARQTADLVAETLGLGGRVHECEALACGGESREVVRFLQENHADCGELVVVGHEPDLGELISFLVTGRTTCDFRMKKGGIGALAITRLEPGQCATLEWLLAPRHLLAIGSDE